MPETQDIFWEAGEDLRPLASGCWVDIVDREVREGTAVTPSAPLATWAIGAPVVAVSISTTATATVVGASIPTTVLEMTGELSASPTVIASTPDASQPELGAASTASTEPIPGSAATITAPPPLTGSVSQTDTRPVPRYSDIAYAVRLSQAGQTGRVADSLLANFQTTRTHEQLIFAIRAMTALLCDVGAFFRERIVGAHLVSEPLQSVHDDLVGALDRFMGDDDHHHTA